MPTIDYSPQIAKSDHNDGDGKLAMSRRAVLASATSAAGVATGLPLAAAERLPATGYGAPLVELHFPAGVLTLEQKGAMIKGVTDVLIEAAKISADQTNDLWVQIFETAEGGWGYAGRVFAPRPR